MVSSSSSTTLLLYNLHRNSSLSSSSPSSSLSFSSSHSALTPRLRTIRSSTKHASLSVSCDAALRALIFDCDGVILESEDLHRQAYNDAFAHFSVYCPQSSSEKPLDWGVEFYDQLQNQIGGGKPKMRLYFKENGWPCSTLFETPPENDADKALLIDTLQDWKTERYKEIIRSGTVEPRSGVLRLMDEAKTAGRKLAVCSAATKSSVVLCLENLSELNILKVLIASLQKLKLKSSDLACPDLASSDLAFTGIVEESAVVVASGGDVSVGVTVSPAPNSKGCYGGDDVKEKKPDPSIYVVAAKKLGVSVKDCLVVEDSVIGLQAAKGAGMSCVITHTSSTANQDFQGAIAVYPDLSGVRLEDLESLL